MHKSKRAQIHMMETIAVLLVFFIMVVIGFVFYVQIIKANIEIEREEARQLQAVEIAQRALFLPELQCSKGKDIIKSDCIDILMLEAFIDSDMDIIGENQLYYHDRLGFSEIIVREVYPDASKPQWVLYDKHLDEFTDKITTHLPVSLKDPKENKYSFGLMQVSVYLE